MSKKQPAQTGPSAVETVPFDEALLADPFYAGQTIAKRFRDWFIKKPDAQPKRGDLTPVELAAFEDRQERVQRESATWPLPGTPEWEAVRAKGEL